MLLYLNWFWWLTCTIVWCIKNISHSIIENFIGTFNFIATLISHLYCFCVIFYMDWIKLPHLGSAQNKDLRVIHGLAELYITLHSCSQNFLLVKFLLLEFIVLIKEHIATSGHLSMHFYKKLEYNFYWNV